MPSGFVHIQVEKPDMFGHTLIIHPPHPPPTELNMEEQAISKHIWTHDAACLLVYLFIVG